MKISLKWLADFFPGLEKSFDLFTRSAELREKLPLSGIEIASYRRLGEGIESVIVAQVLTHARHPNADRLNVCQVKYAADQEPLQIVCGAPNVRDGMKVALARVGTVLPGDFKIKEAEIRGVKSFGMLCSEKELGLSESSEGILDLPESAPVGSTLVNALGLRDEVWEVELTPDRGDCLSHWGLAREVGRLVRAKPQLPEHESLSPRDSNDVPMLSVEVQSKSCWVYGAQLFESVQNGPSPEWLRLRLGSLDVRSHDLLVDLSNDVLFELGHPLHFFDADKIQGSKIIVRQARAGEKLVTLDGVERTLHPQDLVIADLERPLALAGVMGGKDSGVSLSTTRIVLECAVFDPDVIRAMSARHKIHSDASHRFERGVDAGNRLVAAGRAALLLKQLARARRRGAYLEVGADKIEKKIHGGFLNFDLRAFKDIVGYEAQPEEIIRAFQSVFIEAQPKSANVLRVEIPSHRHDLSREIDLIEEAARLLGYERIPVRYPVQPSFTVSGTRSLYEELRRLRRRLAETGLIEMMPYSFISEKERAEVPHWSPVRLRNPLSQDWLFMRPSLSFGLLKVLSRHASLGQFQGGFFDAGTVFSGKAQADERATGVTEAHHLGWALMGPRQGEHWSTDKTGKDRKAAVDFFDGKGVGQSVLKALENLEPRFASTQWMRLSDFLAQAGGADALAQQAPWIPVSILHPGRSALMLWPGKPPGQIVGYVGELHPARKSELLNLATGLQLGAVLGEVRALPDLQAAMDAGRSGQSLSGTSGKARVELSRRLPVVERDLALVVSPDVKAGDLQKTMAKALGPELLELQLIDRFEMPDGRLSLAFRALLQGVEKTLTDAEIQELVKKLSQTAQQKYSAEMRA